MVLFAVLLAASADCPQMFDLLRALTPIAIAIPGAWYIHSLRLTAEHAGAVRSWELRVWDWLTRCQEKLKLDLWKEHRAGLADLAREGRLLHRDGETLERQTDVLNTAAIRIAELEREIDRAVMGPGRTSEAQERISTRVTSVRNSLEDVLLHLRPQYRGVLRPNDDVEGKA
jgi:hypothetical protein